MKYSHFSLIAEETNYWSGIFYYCFIWGTNFFVTIVILSKLFIFGEPLTKPMSSSSVCYWKKRNQAEMYLLRVSFDFFCFNIYFISEIPNVIMLHKLRLMCSGLTLLKICLNLITN